MFAKNIYLIYALDFHTKYIFLYIKYIYFIYIKYIWQFYLCSVSQTHLDFLFHELNVPSIRLALYACPYS